MNPNEDQNATQTPEHAAPTPPPPPPQPNEEEHGPIGPIIGIVIVVLLLVLGALYYFWYRPYTEMRALEENASTAEEIRTQDDPMTERLEAQSESDDLSSIEADLEAESNFDNLDAEQSQIDSELES